MRGGTADPSDHVVLAAIFDGVNGTWEITSASFSRRALFQPVFRASRCCGSALASVARMVGIVTGVAGFIGMWRNVTSSVDLVAEANNYLLPL